MPGRLTSSQFWQLCYSAIVLLLDLTGHSLFLVRLQWHHPLTITPQPKDAKWHHSSITHFWVPLRPSIVLQPCPHLFVVSSFKSLYSHSEMGNLFPHKWYFFILSINRKSSNQAIWKILGNLTFRKTQLIREQCYWVLCPRMIACALFSLSSRLPHHQL